MDAEDSRPPMSTEKDGTAVPPPPDDTDDVTHVKSMAEFRRAADDEVTNVKPLEQLSGAGGAAVPRPANGAPSDGEPGASTGPLIGAGPEDNTAAGQPPPAAVAA